MIAFIDKHRGAYGLGPCRALAQAIEDGPMPALQGVVRLRVVGLCQWLWDGYAVRVS